MLSIVCAAIASGIILSFSHNNVQDKLIRLLCGIFLAITTLSPFANIEIPDLSEIKYSAVTDASLATVLGEEMAEEAIAEIIKQKTETYILDKATVWTSDLDVSVQISDGIPENVKIVGDISPAGKKMLSTIIAEELDISKENQQWIGGNSQN